MAYAPYSSSGLLSSDACPAWQNKIFVHAGCPDKGRVGDLHVFDLTTKNWSTLAPAPDPARGGTALAPVHLNGTPVLLRFGGWAFSLSPCLAAVQYIANINVTLSRRLRGRRAWHIRHL